MRHRSYILSWFGMMIIAVLNGGFRQALLLPNMSPGAAHQISTLMLLILFGLLFLALRRYHPLKSRLDALRIGVLWLLLTLIFEFGIGMLSGSSLTQMLQAYNIFSGNLWILVPIWVLIGPMVVCLKK